MTTYYCDYKNGDDGDTGGTSDPFKTIDQGISALSANDTLLLRGSDVEDEAYMGGAGRLAPPNNTTIQNDTGHSPVIVMYTRKVSGDFSKTAGQTYVYECAHTGSIYTDYGVWHGYSSPVCLSKQSSVGDCDSNEDSYYFDDGNNKVYVHVSGGGAPNSVFLMATVYPTFLHRANQSVTYDGLTWKLSGGAIWLDDAVSGSASGTIQNCTFQYGTTWNASIILQDGDVTISNVTANDLKDYGSGLFSASDSAGNITISNVELTDIDTFGLYSDAGGVVTITDLTLTRVGSASEPPMFSGVTSLSMNRFTIVDGYDNAFTIYSDAVLKYGLIYYTGDVTYGAGTEGIVNHADAADTVELYHITVYNAKATTGDGGPGDGFYIASDSTVKMRNCGAVECVRGIYEASGAPTYDLDYLGFYNNTDDYVNIDAGDEASNEVTTNPQFTDTATYDFTLQSGSPWIDAGVAVAGVNDDYSGSAPDIGRHEYEGGGGAPIIGGCIGGGMIG